MADYDLQYQDTHIDALLATANELKTAGYIYKGVATPSTNPGTPTERVAYLASEPGTYTNFGGIVIASGLYSLTYANGTWTGTQMSAGSDIEVVQTTGDSTTDVMSQKAVTEEIDKTALITPNAPEIDLDITDEDNNVLARFQNGEIKTKKFNSATDGQISVDECAADLEVADPTGNILMLLRNGHIMTKKFDSSKLGDEFNYYATEFEEAEQTLYDKVRNDIDDKTVVLFITTDAHITTEEPYTLKYAKAFRRMAENIGADAIVSLGDIINEKVGTGWDITANRNRIELYMKDTRNTYIPFLYALAHHEMYSSGYPTFLYGYSAEKVLGKTDKYQRYMKPVFDSSNYANFYVDVEPQGLRMIFLDSTNVAGHPVGYTQATVNWLTSVLANSSGNIALFTHAPSKNGYSYNPTNNISKVVNDDLVRTALNAYVQGGGKVLGHYCGHAHCDNYGKESDMEYYIIQTACSVPRVDGGVPSNERPNLGNPIYYSDRAVGTIKEWCIDVACIHTDIDEVHLFRFGVGQDRSITL